ncbi:MATE family efflux transporter [Pseudotenacibaculum haliotis]|uniref:Multidrug export protein MepA n=1 Tax=Pseudotenacibaculum haliotis TaxID=1862138 RepID=A0ABW5LS39_9FLAO
MTNLANELGTEKISKLLVKQAVPASIGILVMSLNMIVDTIFVGQWIGSLAIAAITVVLPIVFLISSIGMGIGIGGSSIISRALGAKEFQKAFLTFGNQISLTLGLSVFFVFIGTFFCSSLLLLFGANGDILSPATEYFHVVLYGVPFLAFAMMGNPVIRAEGKPKFAMYAMIIPAITNIVMDIIFIKVMNMGMYGAGLATSLSYAACGLFIFGFFLSKKSELVIYPKYLLLNYKIVKETIQLGGVTVIRQGTISLLMIVLNATLFKYGGENAIAVYGIINRVMMFALFPVLGVTQGFLPIAGYNYGAKDSKRVKETIKTAIVYGTGVATIIFLGIIIFPETIAGIFTNDSSLISETPNALLLSFLATPVITTQLVGAAYFQAAGKALPALLLTLLKQGIFLIPLVYILPQFFGLNGVWFSFPIADIMATLITVIFLQKEVRKNLV